MTFQAKINRALDNNKFYRFLFNFILPVALCGLFFTEVKLAFDSVLIFFIVLLKIYFANEFVFNLLKENYEMETKLIQKRTKKNNVYPATKPNAISALFMVALMSPFAIYITILEKAKQKA